MIYLWMLSTVAFAIATIVLAWWNSALRSRIADVAPTRLGEYEAALRLIDEILSPTLNGPEVDRTNAAYRARDIARTTVGKRAGGME